MRSLYARIFLSYWIVMAAIVAGAILVTWLVVLERQESLPRVSVDLVGQAASALREGGEPGLRAWLRTQRTPGVRVFVVDERGRELLDRPLPPHRGRPAPWRSSACGSATNRCPSQTRANRRAFV